VLRAYRLLGYDSPLRRSRIGDGLLGRIEKYLGRPLGGWCDTHAARSHQ
jgi:hypothetical protein